MKTEQEIRKMREDLKGVYKLISMVAPLRKEILNPMEAIINSLSWVLDESINNQEKRP